MPGPFKVTPTRSRRQTGGFSFSSLETKKAQSNAAQSVTPKDAVITRIQDPLLGTTTETQEGAVLAGKQKLIAKALEDSERLRGLLPIVDQLEGRYRQLYPLAEQQMGPEGIKDAMKTWVDAQTQSNVQAKSLLDQIEALGATFAKGLGDTGNIARVEREDSLKAISKLKYNPPIGFPDSPAVGVQKFGDFRKLLLTKMSEVDRLIQSGGEVIPDSYRENFPEFFSEQQSSPIPGSPGFKSGNQGLDEESIFQAWKRANP